MPSRDSCFVLHRFPLGDKDLLVKCYFKNFGKRSLLVKNYLTNFKLGAFEPFNEVTLHFEQRGDLLKVTDISQLHFLCREISTDFDRFVFVSKVSKVVLKFVNEPDEGIYQLLLTAVGIGRYFNFNYLRFLINLSTILGFSVQKLDRPGWVNLINLSSCGREEIKNPYCTFISPKEFATLKRVSDTKTKPYEVGERVTEGLESFFFKFFEFRRGQF